MPKPKGYQVPDSERAKIAEAHRERNAGVLFAKNMTDAASRGDMAGIWAILDTYVADQGHTLTDEQNVALFKALFDNLHDKEAAIRALTPEGPYARMANAKGPVARMMARREMDKIQDQGR